MRPPYGLRRPHLKRMAFAEGMEWLVMWSRVAWDWRPQDPVDVTRRLNRVRGGDIVLLHDGGPEEGANRRHTPLALGQALPRWIDAGFQFVTLDAVCR
jgi:peptidoglycan/xylan/chitin deacetylase (PgdA/CDA1 family)